MTERVVILMELKLYNRLKRDLLGDLYQCAEGNDRAYPVRVFGHYHGIAEQYVREYEEQIVYDYNYYRFFKDGYGKDYTSSPAALALSSRSEMSMFFGLVPA
jgi:hypothetical protein